MSVFTGAGALRVELVVGRMWMWDGSRVVDLWSQVKMRGEGIYAFSIMPQFILIYISHVGKRCPKILHVNWMDRQLHPQKFDKWQNVY